MNILITTILGIIALAASEAAGNKETSGDNAAMWTGRVMAVVFIICFAWAVRNLI